MINIRYHIVSITAVFLALGIGVALGSTFLDRATVGVIESNVNSAEARIRDTEAENSRLADQVAAARERDAALLLSGGGELLAGQLEEVPVLVISAPGVNEQTLETVQLALTDAGADLRGRLDLRDSLAFDGDPDATLADALGLDDPTSEELHQATYEALDEVLASAGATPASTDGEPTPDTTSTTVAAATPTTDPSGAETPTTTTTVPDSTESTEGSDGEQPAVVTALIDGEYVTYVPGPGVAASEPLLAEPGYRYVLVGAPDLKAEQNQILFDLLPDPDSPRLPAVVVSATVPPPAEDQEPTAPTVVAMVRASDTLSPSYNSVDNTDTFAGLYATVLTLRDLDTTVPGQYGQAEGATSVLPPAS